MLKVQYALLCEFVRVGAAGAFDFLGIFDRLIVESVPAQTRSLAFVVLVIANSEDDLGKRSAKLTIRGPGPQPTIEQRMDFELKPSGGGWLASARLLFQFQGLPVVAVGKYVFSLAVDNREIASHPLSVVLSDASA